jgi:cellulose biosynthesis protein BcsQ
MAQKIVVAGSNSLRDVLTREFEGSVALDDTNYPDVLGLIYNALNEGELAGVIAYIALDTPQEAVDWLTGLRDNELEGMVFFLSANPLLSVVPLPATLYDFLVEIGYDPTTVETLKAYTIGTDGSVTTEGQNSSFEPVAEPVYTTEPEPERIPTQNTDTQSWPVPPTFEEPEPSPPPVFVAPEPEPVYPQPVQSAPQSRQEASDAIFAQTSQAPAQYRSMATPGAKIVWAVAGKGGVGKSTFATLSSIYLAAHSGTPKVLFIDGNIGQPDIMSYLAAVVPEIKNVRRQTPTIADYTTRGLQGAVVHLKDYVVDSGPVLFSQINLDVVFGIVEPIMDSDNEYPQLVDNYCRLLTEAIDIYDVIVVDTQIIEPKNIRSSLAMSRFEIPFMVSPNSHIVGVINSNTQAYENTVSMLSQLTGEHGIAHERMALLENKIENTAEHDTKIIERASGYPVLGAIRANAENQEVIRSLVNISDSAEIQRALKRLRGWVYNLPTEPEPVAQKSGRSRFFGRRK